MLTSTVVGVRGAQAQGVSARAYVDRSTVGLNRTFVLNVEVTGTQRFDADPELPDMGGFARFLGRSTSTNMEISGGRREVSITVQYRFQAVREGVFEIGGVRVVAAGRLLETEPIELTVTVAPPPDPAGLDEPDVGPKDLFLVAEVSKRRVYENEPVAISYRIYTRVDVSNYTITTPTVAEGFWIEEVPETQAPTVERVVRDGQQYTTAVIRRVIMFATGPGSKKLDPLAVTAQVRMQRRSLSPLEDLFSRSSLFGTVEPVDIASEPVEIEVRPLPESGRPADFTGFVGSLGLTASVDRSTVETNDALTFRFRISGDGNLRSLPAPEIRFPADFEVFPPEVKETIERYATGVKGSRTYEYVLIPRAPGERAIPSVSMSYFDAETGRYATVATRPLTVNVTGDPVVGRTPGIRAGIETLREDIRFIRIGEPRFVRSGRSLFDAPVFWVLALIPLVAVTGAVGIRRHNDRLEDDVAYARGRRAGRVARKRLQKARSLKDGDSKEFHAEVGRALRGFVADKLNVAEVGFLAHEVATELGRRGVSEEVVQEYGDCIATCDRHRFAPSSSGTEGHEAVLERAASAITRLEEGLSS
ncbi:MAG: BatD family protein [Gemmatimonadota bacterium]|nr:MAG: BatD family protein [Gemmatimonadota bacterium]